MTRDQKIKYLQLVTAGEITPVKPLPPGKYIPAKGAKPVMIDFFGGTHQVWDYYTNGKIKIDASVFAAHDCEMEIHRMGDDGDLGLSLDSVTIHRRQTPMELAEKLMSNYEQNTE